jgi:hypothetical protein
VLDAAIRASGHRQAITPRGNQTIEQRLQQENQKMHAAPPFRTDRIVNRVLPNFLSLWRAAHQQPAGSALLKSKLVTNELLRPALGRADESKHNRMDVELW